MARSLPARRSRVGEAPLMRGVAAGRSAQRACERSSDWRRGAASSPDPDELRVHECEGYDLAGHLTRLHRTKRLIQLFQGNGASDHFVQLQPALAVEIDV